MLCHLSLIAYLSFLVALSNCSNSTVNSSDTLKLNLDHYKVPCSGESLQLCYLVSKNGSAPEYFYDEIEGFEFDWGFTYELLVHTKTVRNPKADASTLVFVLDKMIKKEKVPNTTSFEIPVMIDNQPTFISDNGNIIFAGKIPVEFEKYSFKDLMASKFGIFKHNENGMGIVLVAIK